MRRGVHTVIAGTTDITETAERYDERVSWWNDPTARSLLHQVFFIGVVLFAGIWLVSNVIDNLEERQIRTGFSFLGSRASFDISESFIPYSAASTYGQALLVGILNTLHVCVIGILLATILGTVIGISRVSSNWIVAKLAAIYVETFRNIPVLLQLIAWYAAITNLFPPSNSPFLVLPGVYLTKSGLSTPALISHPVYGWMMLAMLGGVALSLLIFFRRRSLTDKSSSVSQERRFLRGWQLLGLVFVPPVLIWLVAGSPFMLEMPQLGRFRITGGARTSSEFLAVLFGLSLYTAAFIAEVVRSGIEAVPKGQVEAARALGLRQGQVIRRIILPQALRVIIPPLTSQYLNLTKNSSLGLAVGYPDLVSVGNTSLNQSGQALEFIIIFMIIYLSLSLSTSAFMNWFNRRIALIEG